MAERVRVSVVGGMIVAILVILVAAVGRPPMPERPIATEAAVVDELSDAVERLRAQVEQLEARLALATPSILEGPWPAGPVAPANAPPAVQMALEGVATVGIPTEPDRDLARFEGQRTLVARCIEQVQQRMALARGGDGGDPGGFRGDRARDTTISGPQRRSDAQLSLQFQRKLRQLEGEAQRRRREMAEPRQVIMGHHDGRVIVLTGTRDLSRVLDAMDRGDRLTWEGRRLAEDSISQEWIVTSVRPIREPEGS